MRIWDIAPGYLNRQSLLGEHRELHGLCSILIHGKRGYSRHPETLRWVGCLSGLARRHGHLIAEMWLRGYRHRSPLADTAPPERWPQSFVTPPAEQFIRLGEKYADREPGRIPLPRSAQELWAHHKYSVMARDPAAYRRLGARVARTRRRDLGALAEELVLLLREVPPPPRLANALEHMWGHVSKCATEEERSLACASLTAMFQVVCDLARRGGDPYLLRSTALGELGAYLGGG